ncbi:energy transducer TonB [uncultured Acinetobacter sp.]|uniref:energy transducer TonB n=1 Tax=uncultured Acinetobacter sp. TaxID=165433 RepID=UPI00262828C0|nr:TonB family protein [uncultured Acinetobacter sp.]
MLKKMTPLQQPWWQDRLFMMMVACAVILHLALLSVQFAMPTTPDQAVKEIAISIRPSSDQIEHSDFLAQADQQGAGTFREAHRIASQSLERQSHSSQGQHLSEQHTIEQQAQSKTSHDQQILMTTLSWQKQHQQDRVQEKVDQLQSQYQQQAAMIAGIEAEYLEQQQNFSRQQKIKTVNGIHAKADPAAGYLEKFRKKVEFYGNRDYPLEAQQLGLAGEVRLMVILASNGKIMALRLLESSGYAVLDEAAKASVRKAAPFPRFDAGLQDIEELRVVRTWRFDPANAEFEVK